MMNLGLGSGLGSHEHQGGSAVVAMRRTVLVWQVRLLLPLTHSVTMCGYVGAYGGLASSRSSGLDEDAGAPSPSKHCACRFHGLGAGTACLEPRPGLRQTLCTLLQLTDPLPLGVLDVWLCALPTPPRKSVQGCFCPRNRHRVSDALHKKPARPGPHLGQCKLILAVRQIAGACLCSQIVHYMARSLLQKPAWPVCWAHCALKSGICGCGLLPRFIGMVGNRYMA